MSRLVIKAKLPVGYDSKAKRLISEEQDLEVLQVGNLREAVKHFGGEGSLVTTINDFIKQMTIRAEYGQRAAQVRPSGNVSPEKRAELAVRALVRTGKFTLEQAKEIMGLSEAA